ncbi:MAG: nucleotidyltransferase [Blautia sp.]|nr:nucleotidyltransferase [Blautia sp.]
MNKTALVVMAAGIGSRFGKGVKQLTPVGPNGELIMDYSVYDALEAGFDKIVFIIRQDLEDEFRRLIGDRVSRIAETVYAFQSMDDLPEGFRKPEGRVKPWGTGQAVLCARHVCDEPFAVINADDYYGKEAYRKVHDYLICDHKNDEGLLSICMAGFRLRNTLSENGSVTRGICHIADGRLTGVTETHDIYKTDQGAQAAMPDGSLKELDPNCLVSMNMWGFTPSFMEILDHGFTDFLSSLGDNALKKEYLLPVLIDQLIREGKAKVDVLETMDSWFGVTYQEDRETVMKAFERLTREGVYPEKLYA